MLASLFLSSVLCSHTAASRPFWNGSLSPSLHDLPPHLPYIQIPNQRGSDCSTVVHSGAFGWWLPGSIKVPFPCHWAGVFCRNQRIELLFLIMSTAGRSPHPEFLELLFYQVTTSFLPVLASGGSMSIFFHGRNMDENDQEFFIIRLGQGSGSFYSPVPCIGSLWCCWCPQTQEFQPLVCINLASRVHNILFSMWVCLPFLKKMFVSFYVTAVSI